MKVSHVAELYNLIIPRKTRDSSIPRMKSKEKQRKLAKNNPEKKHFLYRELLKNTTFFENIYEGVIVFISSNTSVRYRNLSHPKFAVKVV